MAKVVERVTAVSDPNSPDYNPDSPHYDVTADSSSLFYVGPPAGDHKSGDEIRSEVTDAVDRAVGPPGGFLDQMLGPLKDFFVQDTYQDRLEASRERVSDNVELRTPGEPPKTLWGNASHEQMVEVISSNADPSTVAVTSEEWVRLGNDLSDHQKTFGRAINDSLGNWEGAAGDAARTHLAEVAKWLGGTAEGSVLTGRQQEIHSQALNETQRALDANPPVPFSAPEANARLATITDPAAYAMQFSAEMETFHQQQAARGQAAEVMYRYDDTISGAATTPRFTAPPTLLRATRSSPSLMSLSTDPAILQRNVAPVEGTMPQGDGLVRNGMSTGDGTLPNGTPGANIPAGSGAPGSTFSGGGIPGGGGQGTPSMPSLPSTPPAAQIPPAPEFTTTTAPSGLTGPSGTTPPGSFTPPTTPDIPRGSTVPSGFPGGNVPGTNYPSPNFSGPSGRSGPFGPDGERTTKLPTNPQNRPGAPNSPDRGFGPGGVPPVTTGGTPSGGRFGGPGSMPGGGPGGVPGGGGPGAGTPGARGGFGPMGGGGAVSGAAGGAPGGPGVPGGGAPGARGLGASGAPMGGGAGGAGGAGRRDNDEEHEAASYLEGDAELFAPGKVVSPPVIGDWNGKQDWK